MCRPGGLVGSWLELTGSGVSGASSGGHDRRPPQPPQPQSRGRPAPTTTSHRCDPGLGDQEIRIEKKQLFSLPCRPYFLTTRFETRCQRRYVVEKGSMKDKARIVFSYRFSVRGPNYQVLHELRLQQCL